jgi:two-component system OmpR family response regulator
MVASCRGSVITMANVLLVDDIQDVADSFAEVIALFGHDVRVAYGGAHALAEIDLSPPQVALVDLNMPVLDGFELARRIRERWGAGILLVAHTARPRAEVIRAVMDAGFDSFVSKSAKPLELALAIRGRRGVSDLRSSRRDRRTSQRAGSASRRSGELKSHEGRATASKPGASAFR